jgi:hypothetical protein
MKPKSEKRLSVKTGTIGNSQAGSVNAPESNQG